MTTDEITSDIQVVNPTIRWAQLQVRIALLRSRAAAAAEIQQSLPLSEWDIQLQHFGDFVETSLGLREGNETAIDARIPTVEQQLAQLQLPAIKGLPWNGDRVTHHCVTACKEHGHGVFSAHENKEDARYNAALTGGKTDPVERREERPGIVPGPALRDARRLAAEYC